MWTGRARDRAHSDHISQCFNVHHTLDTSQITAWFTRGTWHVTLHPHVAALCSGGGAGSILQFSDFLGGPVGEGFGLAGAAPTAGRQQVGDGLHVQQRHDVAPEGGAQVPDEAGAGGDAGVTVLAVPGHHRDELDDVRHVGLHDRQVGGGGRAVTLQTCNI